MSYLITIYDNLHGLKTIEKTELINIIQNKSSKKTNAKQLLGSNRNRSQDSSLERHVEQSPVVSSEHLPRQKNRHFSSWQPLSSHLVLLADQKSSGTFEESQLRTCHRPPSTTRL